ncbi:MAG: tripartite tricarboxylate transporter substrate binding protein [Pseudomonadota bacterium]
MKIFHRLSGLLVTSALALLCPSAGAQSFPAKPIRLIVPTSAGNPVDVLARVVATRMSAEFGQPVVVENRVGAGGIVAAAEVARQPADGYTLFMVYMGMTLTQTIFKQPSFDLKRDFSPVGQTLFSYNVLVTNPNFPAKSVKELEVQLRARPGQINFASGGIGSPAQMAGELLKQQTNTQATHVPYLAFPQAIGDLLGGQVQFMFAGTGPVVGHIQSGRLKALAVTGPHRVQALKDVPTMAEAGYPDFMIRDWQGIVVKAGTPRDIIDRLNVAMRKALASEELKTVYASLGAEPFPGSPEEFASLIASDMTRMVRIAQTANVRAD